MLLLYYYIKPNSLILSFSKIKIYIKILYKHIKIVINNTIIESYLNLYNFIIELYNRRVNYYY